MPARELRVNRAQQLVRLPSLQNSNGFFFARELPHFPANICWGNGLVQGPLDGQRKPLGRARLHLEAHAHAVAQCAHQPNRLVSEAVDGEGAHFAFFQVGQTIGGVEQEAAGGRVKRNGDGVE